MACADRAACDCDDCMVRDTGRSSWGTCCGGADALGPAVLGLGGSAYPALDPTAWSMTALLDARSLARPDLGSARHPVSAMDDLADALNTALGRCDCHKDKYPRYKGDTCGQGGELAADAEWIVEGGRCRLIYHCENQRCKLLADALLDPTGNAQATYCPRACADGKGGAGTLDSVNCWFTGDSCFCTLTCTCKEGGSGTTDLEATAVGSEDADVVERMELCPWELPDLPELPEWPEPPWEDPEGGGGGGGGWFDFGGNPWGDWWDRMGDHGFDDFGGGGSGGGLLVPSSCATTNPGMETCSELQRGAPGYVFLDAAGVCSDLRLPGPTRREVTESGPCVGEGTHWQCGRTYRYASACCCPCCDDATGAKSQLCGAC